MNLHRETEYALICLAAMAKDNSGHPADDTAGDTPNDQANGGGVYSARTLAESCAVPYDLLCKILQRLSQAGILESIRGPRGGYRLAQDPGRIALSSVIEAVREKQRMVPCLDTRSCERGGACNIRGGVVRMQQTWDDLIGGINLEEFIGT